MTTKSSIARQRMIESRRARHGRGSGYHNLADVDPDARTALCSQCGPVKVRKHTNWWRCSRKSIQAARDWESRNRELAKQIKRDSYYRNKATQHRRRVGRYGLTVEQYRAMVIGQSGLCAICSGQLIKCHIDHCHRTQTVRGLLCNGCNTGLGMFLDDPQRLAAAMAYLEGA